jgi:hypothetical protein
LYVVTFFELLGSNVMIEDVMFGCDSVKFATDTFTGKVAYVLMVRLMVLLPAALVAFSETVNVSFVEYACVGGFWSTDVPPSPNDQLQLTAFVEPSVNWTSNGAVPNSGAKLKYATGFAVYVYEVVAVPPTVVTTTSTAGPAVPAGADILIVVGLVVIPVAAAPPNVTVAPARLVPVMLTNVPAVVGPAAGEMTVIVGAAIYV